MRAIVYVKKVRLLCWFIAHTVTLNRTQCNISNGNLLISPCFHNSKSLYINTFKMTHITLTVLNTWRLFSSDINMNKMNVKTVPVLFCKKPSVIEQLL